METFCNWPRPGQEYNCTSTVTEQYYDSTCILIINIMSKIVQDLRREKSASEQQSTGIYFSELLDALNCNHAYARWSMDYTVTVNYSTCTVD